jgi:hypothetical protein
MSIVDTRKSHFISPKSQPASKVGSNILGYCSRCKMNLTHTIVILGTNNKPNRVQCNTCRTEKQYQPPKSDAELKAKQGKDAMNRDDDQDLDLDAGAKHLIGEDGVKKKSKAKSKAKKSKDDLDARPTPKSNNALPLSMLEGTSEDKAQYEVYLHTHRNHLNHAKEYKPQQKYKVGEILNHKVFGLGFVVAETSVNKIEVLFPIGRKLLAMNLGG